MGSQTSKDLQELVPGDMMEIHRGLYCHWALYVGDGDVVHVTSSAGKLDGTFSPGGKVVVKREKLEMVVSSDRCEVNNALDRKYQPRGTQDILKDAADWVGRDYDYHLLLENCEHFVTLLRYGKEESRQVRSLFWTAVGAAGSAGVAVLLYRATKPEKQETLEKKGEVREEAEPDAAHMKNDSLL
ncbi:HRAS-like suppressor 3 [Denticeps clupeoides]|uniref:LRAT domain-containing protein n=1 Tax=Denticeps clupeoides TaxID=299321 RepID=A0AAY4E0H5_9TELE|nr:HRAS-like suppressor 3 [Denticeps clupeoides]